MRSLIHICLVCTVLGVYAKDEKRPVVQTGPSPAETNYGVPVFKLVEQPVTNKICNPEQKLWAVSAPAQAGTIKFPGQSPVQDWYQAPAQDRPYDKDTYESEQLQRQLTRAQYQSEIDYYRYGGYYGYYNNSYYGYGGPYYGYGYGYGYGYPHYTYHSYPRHSYHRHFGRHRR